MKKIISLTTLLILSVSCLLCGCFFNDVMVIPDNAFIGEPKNFEKDGFLITLTDKFEEEQSQRGFDAYYVADFCGVVVLKEEFTLEEGLAEQTLENYINDVINANGHTGIKPQQKNGLWFYENLTTKSYVRSYSYKGSDSFWIVQFICNRSDVSKPSDIFYLWAESVEVN